MDRLYTALLWFFASLTSPYLLFRLLTTTKHRVNLRQRCGFGLPRMPANEESPCVWFHAVSVGEVRAVLPLMRAVRARDAAARLVLSTVTQTGQDVARAEASVADAVVYFPFDLVSCIRRHLAALRPSLVIIAETELWPNFIRTCTANGIPVALANGRLSPRSFTRYRRLAWFMGRMVRRLRVCGMQSQADLERILALGGDPQRCRVTGNMKFDAAIPSLEHSDRKRLRAAWGLHEQTPLILAGSTHPGEEEALLDALVELQKTRAGVHLLLAPRRVERGEEVAALARSRGYAVRRRGDPGKASVLLLDSMGELKDLYAMADIAFIGGSLAPHGGQNALEAASHAVATVFGPHTFNFADVCEWLVTVGGARRVETGEELTAALAALLDDEPTRKAMGLQARRMVEENRGSVQQHFDMVAEILREAGWWRAPRSDRPARAAQP